jgi:hypothetical protein
MVAGRGEQPGQFPDRRHAGTTGSGLVGSQVFGISVSGISKTYPRSKENGHASGGNSSI